MRNAFLFLGILLFVPACKDKKTPEVSTPETHTQNSPKVISWPEAEPKLRPQIIRLEYLKAHPKTVHSEFADRLAVAYVLDFGKTHRFVSTDDAAAWVKSARELHAVSLANLQKISKGISMQALNNEIVMIDAGDSYDAARLLLPPIRKNVQEFLGEEYRIGIPNRDFLIFWSQRLAPDAIQKLEKQIAEEFAASPNPLSDKVMVFEEGRLAELKD